MRRVILISLVVVLAVPSAGPVLAAGKQAVNLSFFNPISTNRDTDVDTNFRLNLIYGHVGSIRGVDLNGMVSIVNRDVTGFQASGLVSNVGNNLSGVALTGAVAYVKGDATGVQATGLVNYNLNHFKGFQYAFLFNYCYGDLRGVQWGNVFNLVDGDAGFLQVSGVANIVGGSVRGFQLSGGINVVADKINGAQLGVGNLAHEFRGVQVGVFNAARHADGLAVAAFNWQRHMDGIPVGLVNMSETGTGDWVTFGSNISAINSGVRTTVNNWTSVVYVGYDDLQQNREETGFFGWQYGYDFALGSSGKWHLYPDLGYVHIEPEDNDNPDDNDESQFAIQARASVEYRFNRTVSVFLGSGISTRWSGYSSSASTLTQGLVFGGLSLF